jgi:hypothetical protein
MPRVLIELPRRVRLALTKVCDPLVDMVSPFVQECKEPELAQRTFLCPSGPLRFTYEWSNPAYIPANEVNASLTYRKYIDVPHESGSLSMRYVISSSIACVGRPARARACRASTRFLFWVVIYEWSCPR